MFSAGDHESSCSVSQLLYAVRILTSLFSFPAAPCCANPNFTVLFSSCSMLRINAEPSFFTEVFTELKSVGQYVEFRA